MKVGSTNLVVRDADKALTTFLKILGTNNVKEVIKLKGLSDTVDTVDGYYIRVDYVDLGIYQPHDNKGRMGSHLERYGEGIHHLTMHIGQDEFEHLYERFKSEGWKVSDKIVWIGKFTEAVFWLEEGGETDLPVQFATKAYRGLKKWQDVVYLDTPIKFERLNITKEYTSPRVCFIGATISVKEYEKQKRVWSSILSRPPCEGGNLFTNEYGKVEDGRGNTFTIVMYPLPGGSRIALYHALNEDAPINKVMARRNVKAMHHHMSTLVTRDKIHQYWEQLEEAGFDMLDPMPPLNTNSGNGNYFFFTHPRSTHGALCEFISLFKRNEADFVEYDWTGTETYMVPPEINMEKKTLP